MPETARFADRRRHGLISTATRCCTGILSFVRDDVGAYPVERPGDPDAALIADDTGFVKAAPRAGAYRPRSRGSDPWQVCGQAVAPSTRTYWSWLVARSPRRVAAEQIRCMCSSSIR
ncbi:hypothetical protein [Actinoplanes siamensis]|uniref:hypothetical protein n=1 Tax=Actinoplanes siamensis TaxID=1223317 RepID=UPI00194216BC|nr:hypothetical protein [Actinoplanes siamensis]